MINGIALARVKQPDAFRENYALGTAGGSVNSGAVSGQPDAFRENYSLRTAEGSVNSGAVSGQPDAFRENYALRTAEGSVINGIVSARANRAGQPDAFCDYVTALIRDAHLRADPDALTDIRVAAMPGVIVISGEALSRARVDYEDIVWVAISDVGYLTGDLCPNGVSDVEICVMVKEKRPARARSFQPQSAVNCAEALAREICAEIDDMQYRADWLCPDGWVEAAVLYENGLPAVLESLVIHAQHAPETDPAFVGCEIRREIVDTIVPRALMRNTTHIEINPEGAFVFGGPAIRPGVSGR